MAGIVLMMSPSDCGPHGALSCEKLRAQMGKWLKVDYSAPGFGERHSDCFHNCLLIKGRCMRRHATRHKATGQGIKLTMH